MRVTVTSPDILERLVADPSPLPNAQDTVDDAVCEACITGDSRAIEDYIENQIARGRAEVVAGLLALILSHPNPQLTVGCLAIAANLPIYDGREAELARLHGVSRSAVCQRVRTLRTQLGLN